MTNNGDDFKKDMVEARKASLQGPSYKRGLQSQQKAGIVMFIVLLLGGGWYLLKTSGSGGLSGAETTAFQSENGTNYGNLSIAAPSNETPQKPEEVIQAVVRQEAVAEIRDSEETLRRLENLTQSESKARALIAELKTDLAVNKVTLEAAQANVTRLEDELDAQVTRFNETLKQELRRLELQYGNEIARLKGELEIAIAGTSESEGEQRKRLEAARELRRQQIESEALIFDNSDEISDAIKY